jgi:hypothetical protein
MINKTVGVKAFAAKVLRGPPGPANFVDKSDCTSSSPAGEITSLNYYF